MLIVDVQPVARSFGNARELKHGDGVDNDGLSGSRVPFEPVMSLLLMREAGRVDGGDGEKALSE